MNRYALMIVLTLLLPMQTATAASSVRIFVLSADTWAQPRAGEVLPQMEPVRLAVNYWQGLGDAILLLSYPGEDSGELWAAELKDWLVSLGVPSDYIYLSPGLRASGELRIMVGQSEELIQ